ncbi:MAG: penicillin-binding protein 2 [Patescibacteria group bacterium]
MSHRKAHSWTSHGKKNHHAHSWFDRIRIVQIGFLVFAVLLAVRLFDLQILRFDEFREAAADEHEIVKKLDPRRGSIYVREHKASQEAATYFADVGGEKLFPAVINREYRLIFAVPRDVSNASTTAVALAPLLGAESATLFAKLSKPNDGYEVLKRKVSKDTYEKIRELKLSGIGSTPEWYRAYPEKGMGGHIFGFVGYAGDVYRGVYGLEGYYEDLLKGSYGSLKVETDLSGSPITTAKNKTIAPINGSDLVLTIDRTVQLMTCSRLKAWVLQHGADGGTAIIVDPKTGAIRAMCSTPDFDPEEYAKSDVGAYTNPAIFKPYEPGSTFKTITMAMGLETGKVNPASTYFDSGAVTIGPYTIKNSDGKAHGVQTMTQLLDESLNTGAIHVARKVGRKKFLEFVKQFGFGTKSGIELDKETAGNITSLKDKNEIYLATASFGQGITVTPLQLVSAYAALANGGTMMQPYIVDAIRKADGTVMRTNPKALRRVISERSAALLSGMLVSVVRNGHGKRAGVESYFVAGKTGTSQVSKKDARGYEAHETIGSFVGFAPVENPRFAMLVKIDRPRDVQWAESSAAPLFGELAKFLLNYYDVPPDEKAKVKSQK